MSTNKKRFLPIWNRNSQLCLLQLYQMDLKEQKTDEIHSFKLDHCIPCTVRSCLALPCLESLTPFLAFLPPYFKPHAPIWKLTGCIDLWHHASHHWHPLHYALNPMHPSESWFVAYTFCTIPFTHGTSCTMIYTPLSPCMPFPILWAPCFMVCTACTHLKSYCCSSHPSNPCFVKQVYWS